MAIVPGNSTSNTAPGAGDLVLNVPTGVQDADVLIVSCSIDPASTVTIPDGWQEIVEGPSYSTLGMRVYIKRASSEPASYTWTVNAAAPFICTAYRGVLWPGPLHVDGSYAITDTGETYIDAPAATSYLTGDHLMCIYVCRNTGDIITMTPPVSMAERVEVTSDTYAMNIMLADEALLATGDTGTRQATLSATAVTRLAMTLVLHAADDDRAAYVPAASTDDGRWRPGSTYVNNETSLAFGNIAGSLFSAWFRFPNCQIPIGATVTNALLMLSSQTTTSANYVLTVKGVAADNPAAPVDLAACVALAPTTATVAWTGAGKATHDAYCTPDLTTILQELLDRVGRNLGDAFMLTVHENGSDDSGYVATWAADGLYSMLATLVIDYIGLVAPSNLVATAADRDKIDLSWTDNSNNESQFAIERSLDGETGWTEIDRVNTDVTTYQDTGLTLGITYYYRVRASGTGYSDYSNIASATTHIAYGRSPRLKIEVNWTGDSVTWVDESAYAERASGVMETADERAGPSYLGSGGADTCTITLRNPSGRFSASNSGGALYDNIKGNGGYGKLVKVSTGFPDIVGDVTYTQQFIGHMKEPRETYRPKSITWQAQGRAAGAAAMRRSTVLYQDTRADDYLESLRALVTGAAWASGGQDVGLEYLTYAWLDDSSVWTEMVRVAEAEGGRVYFDKLGQLRFENYVHLLQHNTSDATLRVASFADLQPRFDYANIYNHIVVKWTPRYLGTLDTIWQAEDAVAVPADGTATLWARFANPVDDIVAPVSGTDWTARTSSYITKTADVSVTIPAAGAANRYAQRVLVTLTNANTTHQLYVEGLQLRGYPILTTGQRVAEASDQTSIDAYGERVLPVDNAYVQSQVAAESLASMLLQRYKNPRQYVEVKGVPGLPDLEIGDRLTVTETAQTGISRAFYLVRIAWQLERKYTMDLTLIEAARFDGSDADFAYSDYFIVGTTALGSAGKVFW